MRRDYDYIALKPEQIDKYTIFFYKSYFGRLFGQVYQNDKFIFETSRNHENKKQVLSEIRKELAQFKKYTIKDNLDAAMNYIERNYSRLSVVDSNKDDIKNINISVPVKYSQKLTHQDIYRIADMFFVPKEKLLARMRATYRGYNN